VLSTSFGVGVFLTLLFFVAHVLLNLWTISMVDEAAHQAATSIALSEVTPDEARKRAAAIDRARKSLGEYGGRVDFEFQPDPTGRTVVLRVRAPELNLLPPAASSALGVGGLDRTIVVRREDSSQ
jgi:hypothetical protein